MSPRDRGNASNGYYANAIRGVQATCRSAIPYGRTCALIPVVPGVGYRTPEELSGSKTSVYCWIAQDEADFDERLIAGTETQKKCRQIHRTMRAAQREHIEVCG